MVSFLLGGAELVLRPGMELVFITREANLKMMNFSGDHAYSASVSETASIWRIFFSRSGRSSSRISA